MNFRSSAEVRFFIDASSAKLDKIRGEESGIGPRSKDSVRLPGQLRRSRVCPPLQRLYGCCVPGWSEYAGNAVCPKSKPADGRRQPKRRQSIKSAHFGERLLFTFRSRSATIGECRTFPRFPKRTSKPIGPRQGLIAPRGVSGHANTNGIGPPCERSSSGTLR